MEIENNQDISTSTITVTEASAYFYIKRYFDILFSIIAIILLIIPLFLVAILIKLVDPNASIFFKQERIGKNGAVFFMYKFRSMHSDAEERLEELLQHNEIEGAMFKMKNDPRVTPIGKIIRKYSIDEFPQLINVVRGEMSLVGPRPPLPREVLEYTPYDKQRLLITPGITGLWQISGRNSLSFQEMVRLDLEYIKKKSLLLDIIILIKTITVILKSSDAY